MIKGGNTLELASVCDVFTDGDWIESKDQSVAGVRLIQTGNVGEGEFKERVEKARFVSVDTFKRLRCTQIFPGDCLISRLPEPVGRACIVPDIGELMITAVDCTIARFRRDTYLPEFFTYFSQSKDYQDAVEAQTTGTTRSRISRARLGQVRIPATLLPEQRRIVAILDEAFEAIATAKANTERCSLAGRELGLALEEACFDQHGDDAFAARSLADLCDLIVDCEHKTAPIQETGYPSIRTPNIGRGALLLDKVNRVSEDTYREWTRRAEPQPGDLILAREAPAGNVAVIPEGLKVCLGQRTVLIRPKRNVFVPEYLCHYLLQRRNQERLLAHSRGATVEHINMKDIRAFLIARVPPLAVQQQVVGELFEIGKQARSLENIARRKLTALDELKQSLLHQAFTGQLTAKTADRQLAEAA